MFVDKEGVENVLEAPIGKSLLEVAHDNEIELEGVLTISNVKFSVVLVPAAISSAKLGWPSHSRCV